MLNNNDPNNHHQVVGADPEDDGSCTSHYEERAPTEEDKIDVAAKEDKAVWFLRIVTAFVLISAALLVCLAVYFGATNSETVDFEDDFLELSEKLVDSFQKAFHQGTGILEDFTFEVTSYTLDTNTSWPYVTVPDFERRAGRSARLSGVLSILFLPIVQLEEKETWQNYTVANRGWREEAIALQRGIPVEDVQVPPFPPIIYQNGPDGPVPVQGEGPFFPIWQTYPAVPLPFNNGDMHAIPMYAKPIDYLVKAKTTVYPPSYDFWGVDSDDIRRTLFNQYLNAYEEDMALDYLDDPIMPLIVPVFDSPDEETRQVKAITISALYWRTYFQGLLPPGANGVVVILENTCGQYYTYRISGADAQFVGHGELYDTKYEHLEVTAEFQDAVNVSSATEIDLEGAHCEYRLRVYPSQEFEDDRTTNKPAMYTIMLAAVFVFTSAVFLLYDYCVEKRQKKVMKTALQTTTVVNSLFPKAVREQMYKDQESKKAVDKKEDWLTNNNNAEANTQDNNTMTTNNKKQEANAHLYPETTICFADIAGFTQWSSSRSPEQVFELLEAIYGSFDKLAHRRNVFKIETIGDCYVCATGIPHSQPDHAVIMAKFASDCLKSLRTMIHDDLIGRLGDDTADLAMRFGFHSGPTTAGVLRGEKARFQIFGDTVNTAARMESNGLREKIQVSEASATLLRAAGKSHWLTPREDLVAAKGKGFMQTYWVHVKSAAGTYSPSVVSVPVSSSTHSGGHSTPVFGRGISMDEGQEEDMAEQAPRQQESEDPALLRASFVSC